MASKKTFIFLGLAAFLSFGFRIFPSGNQWPLDKSTTATSKIFVVYPYGSRTIENDLPATDPSSGSTTVSIDNLMTSIFNDYNGINASFLVLAGQSDTDFSANSAQRTITIEEADPNGASSGGEAQQARTGGQVTSCSIKLKTQTLEKAKTFVTAVTHEIGHCLGLDHPQEITKSVMSYFQSGDEIRLQDDDKMGLTYLYPVDSAKAKETATLGMSCSRTQ